MRFRTPHAPTDGLSPQRWFSALLVGVGLLTCLACGALDHGVRPSADAGGFDRVPSADTLVDDIRADDTTPETLSTGCPDHAVRVFDTCECESDFEFNHDCSACLPLDSPDICPKNMSLQGEQCQCLRGFLYELACGCEPRTVGAPCIHDNDCFEGGVCLTNITNFGWFVEQGAPDPTWGIALPGGYCSVRLCQSSSSGTACETWQGECVQVNVQKLHGEVCLTACSSTHQCRKGYDCRVLNAADIPGGFAASPLSTQMYCLPVR